MIDIKVPTIGESINEVTLLRWNKKEAEWVERDDMIAELESEKATFEVNAEKAGVLHLGAKEGDTLKIGDTLATIDESAAKPQEQVAVPKAKPAAAEASGNGQEKKEKIAVSAEVKEEKKKESKKPEPKPVVEEEPEDRKASPVASAMIADKGVDPKSLKASGFHGKILKEDVLAALSSPGRVTGGKALFSRDEKKEKMSPLRKTISRRLVEAKNTTAMLTTFNEVDMGRIVEIRNKYKDKFKEVHGAGLGFMSFFVKACCVALQEWPATNAYLDGDNLVYHEYCDISIAVSTPRGLTVPVIRNAESLGMAEIEKKVAELAVKARDGKLSMEELQGGTFTITNGGVFGSLMSTPILNLPQSAILGMHKIEDRPVALNGQVAIRPMMYIALSYDHRIIDGRESVGFLVRVKELLEHPDQLLFGSDPIKTLLEL